MDGSPRDDVRPADFAITGNRLLLQMLYAIYHRRYERMFPNNLGRALEVMLVSMQVSVGTREGRPPTQTELHKKLLIKRQTVERALDTLVDDGTVTRSGYRYVADLDNLDSLVDSLSYIDRAIALLESTVNELKRLRELMRYRMRP